MQDYQAHAAYKINGKWCIKITKAAKVRAGTGQACITSCRSAADASPAHAAPPSLVTYTNRPLNIEGGTQNVPQVVGCDVTVDVQLVFFFDIAAINMAISLR